MKTKPAAPVFDPDAFRDSIATVDATGHRRWIFPKKPHGTYYQWRKVVAYICLALMFSGPLLRFQGQPLFLFNLLERKFIIFGLTFWPQDFNLLMLAMVTFFVFIVLFTAIFGRIWCGWTCPQTVFMEMVFRPIEYLIEGDAAQQRKLKDMPWNTEKILKRTAKVTVFAILSFLIGNTVMAYIVGTDELAKIVTESPLKHWGLFTFVLIFSGLFFFVFAYLREQACIAICPYGRLQGVLVNKDTLAVSYDHVRGEPRGHLSKQESSAAPKGDCIDCKLCVAVCPTGIDIRNGTQLECINCTACMDACDEVMTKIERPRGLVRIASQQGIIDGIKVRFTPRVLAYSAVLVVLVSVLGFSLASRSPVETTILRTPGLMYQKTQAGYISNLYNIQLINKTQSAYTPEIRILSPAGCRVRIVGDSLPLAAQSLTKGVMFVDVPEDQVLGDKTQLDIEVWADGIRLDHTHTNFFGPIK
ncbi:MAG: cytochrome c oxidase accessory protein CcoG [Bacteroidia bacterium]|nr:cytochrome c oxidase accessory protein CcoG [Bacteroidia bacterium]